MAQNDEELNWLRVSADAEQRAQLALKRLLGGDDDVDPYEVFAALAKLRAPAVVDQSTGQVVQVNWAWLATQFEVPAIVLRAMAGDVYKGEVWAR